MQNALLDENPNRYVMFPIQDNDLWNLYKKQEAVFWRVEEIDFSKDLDDWNNKLNDDERHFIKMILAFFACSDGVVIENIGNGIINQVQLPEAKALYAYQMMMENIHSITYSTMIESYITDTNEKLQCFKSIEYFPCIRKKMNWATQWGNETFSHRIVANAIVEGVFFSGAFCSIYWLKKRGLMKGLSFSNELISRDEALHTETAVVIYKKYCERLEWTDVMSMFMDAVDIEKDFICNALPCRLIGMNSDLMCQYIEFVADRLLDQLGYYKIYKVPNPFDFMEMISLEGKSSFFEVRVSEYSKAEGERNLGDWDGLLGDQFAF